MSGSVLSAGQAAMVLFGGFIGLLIVRVPVAFALGLACVPILLIEPRLSLMMLAQETFNAYNSFILLAVPFFLLTANLMSIGGITDRLVTLSRSMVGHWPGSLAQINVVLSVFFAGISGSSTADAASQSKIFIDAQNKEGYDLSFSIAITAVSAVKYKESTAGTLTTVTASNYATSFPTSSPGRIVPISSYAWPTLYTDAVDRVQVSLTAGYGSAVNVPMTTRAAIRYLVAQMVEFREPVVLGMTAAEIPQTLKGALDDDCWGWYG